MNSIKVTYNQKLIRSALNRYFLKRLGLHSLLALIVMGPFLFFVRPWGSSAIGTALDLVYLVAISLLVIVYLVRLRQSETTLSKMKSPVVEFGFTDKGIHWKSDLGAAEMIWAAFDEVLKFKEFWLLVYAKSGYLTLPTSELTEEIKSLIDHNCAKPNKQLANHVGPDSAHEK